ncbi:hypothetical protein LCGC14_1747630 [marine sediment metagenome]|uniref:Uncharacterized protein n=1 Tax=marine sediment metagenome TaxID=412755 RepID=A0A0F9HS69_9ZZZZ
MRALLIKVDFQTGKRAGGINPRDSNLSCYGWQDLNGGLEIRLVEDDRDLSQYKGAAGVTILNGKKAINQAIMVNIPTMYAVKDKELLLSHLKERNVPLNTFAGKTLDSQAGILFKEGMAGIVEKKPRLVE